VPLFGLFGYIRELTPSLIKLNKLLLYKILELNYKRSNIFAAKTHSTHSKVPIVQAQANSNSSIIQTYTNPKLNTYP
jgi:hypothetical protein